MTLIQSFLLLFIITLSKIKAKDLCINQVYLNSLAEYKVRAKSLSSKDCSEINFIGNEKLNSHLGLLRVAAVRQEKNDVRLNISFFEVKWNKAYLKLSEIAKPENSFCKMYSTGSQVKYPINEMFDPCFILNNYHTAYELEFKAEQNTDILYKKIVFELPPRDAFDNSVSLPKRAIFLSTDTSSNYGITLKIQNLPLFYNVTYYKVEVFREKDKDALLDVRLIKAENSKEISFEYLTYNEEGYYFFKVSAVNDICPEDVCLKSVSPKVYIKRKYPPLVIGIVGASFLIPFVLFIFHMLARRNQTKDESDEERDRVYIVFNQTPQTHYSIIKTFEKSLKSLTNVQIVTKITEATHILYICGTHIFEPDAATHKFLITETNKVLSDIDIFVVSFPYSTKDIPLYLKRYLRFNLMEEFGKLIHVFNCDVQYEDSAQYMELSKQVKAAQIQTEPTKITLNMPIIIVTEQSDSSDTEPKEGDVLL